MMIVLTAPRRRNGMPVGGWLLVIALMAAAILGSVAQSPVSAEQAGSSSRRVAAASIDAGEGHTCVVLTTGAVRCWGAGGAGQLGHNSPANIADGLAQTIAAAGDVPVGGRVTAIAAASDYTCALLSTGAVRCWGDGSFGQLGYNNADNVGDGTGKSITEAGNVPLGGKATAISVGGHHSCALLTTGAVRCWGDGAAGQLGYNSIANVGDGTGKSITAAGNVPLGGKATAIAAGYSHTCVLMTTKAVRCWGYGFDGQLGHDSAANVGDGVGPSLRAAGNVPLGGWATALTAGDSHTCALLTTGAVRCWGLGVFGSLGYGNTANVGDGTGPSISTAGDVPLGNAKAMAISAGGNHTCAVLSTEAVRCWGRARGGQLGYNSTATVGDGVGPSITAAGDVPLGAKAVAVTTGQVHTCALLVSKAVRCWGVGIYGRLGYNGILNIGDGIGPAIQAAGDVPVDAAVRVRAATSLSARVAAKRDRLAPYVYAIKGRVEGRFPIDGATCRGKIRATVLGVGRLLVSRTVRLDQQCSYHARIRLKSATLQVHHRTRLTARIRYLGTANLEPSRTERLLAAH